MAAAIFDEVDRCAAAAAGRRGRPASAPSARARHGADPTPPPLRSDKSGSIEYRELQTALSDTYKMPFSGAARVAPRAPPRRRAAAPTRPAPTAPLAPQPS